MLPAIVLLSGVFQVSNAHGRPPIEECEETGDPKCPPGYTMFNRENSARPWCMKVFDGKVTFKDAERICRCQGGATLSGVNDDNEYNWVLDETKHIFSQKGIENGGIWLGAYRRQSCLGLKSAWKPSANCAKENIFLFTDRSTYSDFLFDKWLPGIDLGSNYEKCVQLLISTADSELSGKINDKTCSLIDVDPSGDSITYTHGFVCGRPAVYPSDIYASKNQANDDEAGTLNYRDGPKYIPIGNRHQNQEEVNIY
ncbi:unnamed protein product [Caenorhabditis bovis]|uniref:C-type lectin domain-containing protein n=1 Tax=Caenorhabditis bovis TaxID=2654633 RepID=A0A8S1FDI1_9PELO|nr:unnamed protein product [Caenorhabditis bovis]